MDKSGDALGPADIIVSQSGSGITRKTNIRVSSGWLPWPAAEWVLGRIHEGVRDPRKEALRRAREMLRQHKLPVFEPLILSDPVRYDKTNVQHCQPLRSVTLVSGGPSLEREYGGGVLRWALPADTSDGLCSLENYVIKVRGYAEDSPAGFAARIVCAYLDWYWACEIGDVTAISDTAHDLSALICMEQMKRQWDAPAVLGKKTTTNLTKGPAKGAKTNKLRGQAAAKKMRSIAAKASNTPPELRPSFERIAKHVQHHVRKPNGERYGLGHIKQVLRGKRSPDPQPARNKK